MARSLHTSATRRRAPTHPGELLKEDVLPAAGLSVAHAARILGVSRQLLHGILAARRPVTAETAVRLGALFGNGPDLWMGMQVNYDLWRAQKALRSTARRIAAQSAVAASERKTACQSRRPRVGSS